MVEIIPLWAEYIETVEVIEEGYVEFASETFKCMRGNMY